MKSVTLLGCYGYEDKHDLGVFLHYLKQNSPDTPFMCIEKLPDGLYGVTHYQAYQEVLKSIKTDYVILTDTRDVVIQKPLESLSDDPLAFFSEHSNMTLGTCPYNSQWIKDYYGEEGLETIRRHSIVNCSIVSGTVDRVRKYVDDTLAEINIIAEPKNGIDMAVINWMFWHKRYKARLYNHHYPVFTCGYSQKITVQRHTILNEYGDIPIMVHQYDRHLSIL